MTRDGVLAFRLARVGLGAEGPASPADALACPAQDFVRDAVPLALLARLDLTADAFRDAVDAGDVVVGHVVRGAIHGVAPGDWALWGRALLARDGDELARQLGRQVTEQVEATGIGAADQLGAVADAVTTALAGDERLDRADLHEALRSRLPESLLPWCTGCRSHHVAPMLWRFATVAAGARLDADRRYVLGKPGRAPAAHEAVSRFLATYGPADAGAFAEWAGVAKPHARRLWDAAEVAEVEGGWARPEDVDALADPPDPAPGTRLLPPGDPALARPNREAIAPDADVRKRLFRPVASPGAVLRDGRLVGLWRVKAKGRTVVVTVEATGRVRRAELQEQADRIAAFRGATGAELVLG